MGERRRGRVLLDDGGRDDDATSDCQHNEADHEEYCSRFRIVFIAVAASLEEAHHLAEGLRNAVDRRVHVVDLGERVPCRDTHAGEVALPPCLDQRIDPDHQAGEEDRRDDDEVTEAEGGPEH